MHPIDETLEAHLHRHQVSGRPVYGALVMAFTVILAALPLVRVELPARAPGIIRPAVEKHVVKAATAGLVRAVHVSRHDSVADGQVLVTLENAAVLARRDAELARLREIESVEADLEPQFGSTKSPGPEIFHPWGGRRAELRAEAAGIRLRLIEIDERLASTVVRAPLVGTVEELAALSPGSFVAAGEELAVISPAGDLVAELLLPSRDIGRVGIGSPVRLSVDAYDQNEWGGVGGQVAEISSDVVATEDGPRYRVVVEFHSPYVVRADGRQGHLMKGMTVQANFVAGEPTLWQLLRNDLESWLHPNNEPA